LVSLYSLIRPRLPTASEAGRFTDGLVGTLNGALGGATGFHFRSDDQGTDERKPQPFASG
jgi:hypothetical protein